MPRRHARARKKVTIHHSPKEKIELRRRKKKEGPSNVRRRLRRHPPPEEPHE